MKHKREITQKLSGFDYFSKKPYAKLDNETEGRTVRKFHGKKFLNRYGVKIS